MDKKKSEFDKVFSAWDILVIAFGAMIGWGWVVSSGDWIQSICWILARTIQSIWDLSWIFTGSREAACWEP